MGNPETVRRRCAIYTRKSTEEGLAQDFNSLDAQREACAAYIASQKHEGWEPVADTYDDGGFSGGTMDRPGIKQLLAEVEAGRVDVIVVYKVDRLTRSLADFAKIVEVLDKRGASFVSVTQSFNTTTSMGRLTLNVLLSFAQFEREVTGERIRDKIAASKAKGMWMGGPTPLGYDVQYRNLVINETEAATVRHIFRRYAELRSIGLLADELVLTAHRTKQRHYKDGRRIGGIPFQKGPLSWMLQNRIYIGDIVHKGSAAPGRHPPIIERSLFDEAQTIMASNRRSGVLGTRGRQPSLLTGMLLDPDGRPMSPVHATRDCRRYRYYATRTKPGDGTSSIVRLPAGEIERLVIDMLEQHLRDPAASMIEGYDGAEELRERMAERQHLANGMAAMTISEQRQSLMALNARVQLLDESVALTLGSREAPSMIEVPAKLFSHGFSVRLAIAPDGGVSTTDPDPVLLRLLVHARAAHQMLIEGKQNPIVARYSKEHLMKLLRIRYLAPDIITAIIEGRQPAGLTGRRLLRANNVPHLWADQRRLFGFV